MDELKRTTKELAIQLIQLVEKLDKSIASSVIGKQLIRSGTSVGANYRAAIRSKSPADFIAKMGIVEEEADECMYWLDLLVEAGKLNSLQTKPLQNQANQIVAMTVSSIKTARAHHS